MIQQSSNPKAALNSVLAVYLQAVDAGELPDRADLLATHPELADDLLAFFADHDQMTQAAAPVRDALAETAPAEVFPQTFGDYELIEEIGRGGMGVVYKARQISLNRVVALKRIRAGQLASMEEVTRFRREAEAAAGLDHPHIVPIYEIGEHAGHHYFTMKLIDGGNLNAHLARFADARVTADLMIKIARAVHHAHQRGILHRDLKPGNILIDAEGNPHVSDLGLAQPIEKEAKLTQSGAIVGTAEYMAPEQARGEKNLTTAADVYGLGAILYVLLSGRPPFQGDYNWDTLKKVVEEEPISPRSFNRQANRDLETICLKCLQKNPAMRYGSAELLAEDLERFLAGVPIRARPIRMAHRFWKWVKRRPARAALVVVGLMVLGLAVWLSYEWPARRNAEALASAETARRQAEEKLAIERQWSSLSHQAVSQRLAGDRWRALATLKELAELQSQHPGLGEAGFLETEAIEAAKMPGVRRIAELAFRNLDFAELSPDGSQVLILGSRPDSDSPKANHTFGAWVYLVKEDRLTLHEKSKIDDVRHSDDYLKAAFVGSKVVLAAKGDLHKVFTWDPAGNRDTLEEKQNAIETWSRLKLLDGRIPYLRRATPLGEAKMAASRVGRMTLPGQCSSGM